MFGDVGDFDRDLSTVVVTHGWQPVIGGSENYTGAPGSVEFLDTMYERISAEHGSNVNVLLYSWEGSFTGASPTPSNISAPLPFVTEVGVDLGTELAALLGGSDYGKEIHLIGHSYGSAVNITAASELSLRGINTTHMTVLDAPTDAPIGDYLSIPSTTYDLAASSSPWIEYVDNYYGTKSGLAGAYGAPISGAELSGGYRYFGDDHGEVWETYATTIGDSGCSGGRGGFVYSAALGSDGCFDRRPGVSTEPSTPAAPEFIDAILDPIFLELADFDVETSTASISTGSDGYGMFLLGIPDTADALIFDVVFDLIGDGDWLEVVLGDQLVGAYNGLTLGTTKRSLMFDVRPFAGTTEFLTLFMHGDSNPEKAAITASNFRYALAQTPVQVPLPTPGLLLIAGVLGLVFSPRRAQ